jgi:ATP/maltotriose-dependent transcriptional regulator MalT
MSKPLLEGVEAARVVGREHELRRLEDALARLQRGVGDVVVLSGEPGIGKTLLLSLVVHSAEARSFKTVEGRSTEFEREVPFGLVVDALDDCVAALDCEQVATLGDEIVAELALILPSLAGHRGPLASGLQAERYRAHHALRSVLDLLAADAPLVLVLDDVHWADEASTEFVCHLLRHRSQRPLLLVLAFRPDSTARLLRDTVAAAAREGMVHEIALGPLRQAEAERLLIDTLSPELKRRLLRASGGNPFYLIELARAASRHSEEAFERRMFAPDVADAVPRTVIAAIREELAYLSRRADLLLRAAAVVGEPLDFDLAAAISELGDSDARAALDELLDRGLLKETDAPLRLRFRHPIVRQAVYESAGEGWRILAHGRAADALERQRAPVTVRAHHVERSASWGDEQAISLLSEAADQVAARAPAAAAAWLRAAVRLLPTTASSDQRLGLLVRLAVALGASGRVGPARAALTDALALVPEGLAVVRARLVGSIARLDHMLGRHGEAEALLNDTLKRLPQGHSVGAAALHLELAMDYWLTPDWKRMAVSAATAMSEAQAVGDPVLAATAASVEALAAYYLGEIDAAQQLVDQARTGLDSLPDAVVSSRIEGLMCLGHAEFGMEQFSAASEHLTRGIAIARATGQNPWFVLLTCLLGVAELWQGKLASADNSAKEAIESALLTGGEPLIWAWGLQCWVATLRGDIDEAIDFGERAIELLEGSSSFIFGWLAHCCLAAAVLEAGDAERAISEILTHAGGETLEVIERSWHPRWYEVLASAELMRGELDAAEQWVLRAEASASELRLPGRIAEALRARANLELARGNAPHAADAAIEAVELFAAAGRRVDEGRAQIVAARALAVLGHGTRAERELEQAHSILAACGAKRYRDQAARELRRLGRKVARPGAHRRTGNVNGVLTPREAEVAALVARGRTNREIADELFLSSKTIEAHVAKIFQKLSVSSRSGVASAITNARL